MTAGSILTEVSKLMSRHHLKESLDLLTNNNSDPAVQERIDLVYQEVQQLGTQLMKGRAGTFTEGLEKTLWFRTEIREIAILVDRQSAVEEPPSPPVQYCSAKVLVVGEAMVGKTNLCWQLAAPGDFDLHESHGAGVQIWPMTLPGAKSQEGFQQEIILWEFGKEILTTLYPQLLEGTMAVLLLYDVSEGIKALETPRYWMEQFKNLGTIPTAILVGARADRTTTRIPEEQLEQFCQENNIRGGHLCTSSETAEGVAALREKLVGQIQWETVPRVSTSKNTKQIRDIILARKTWRSTGNVLLSRAELRRRLESADTNLKFSEADLQTAISILENNGYLTVITNFAEEEFVVLSPFLLSLLSASIIAVAAKHAGVLREADLIGGRHTFPELQNLPERKQKTMLEAAILWLTQYKFCIRGKDGPDNILVFATNTTSTPPTPENQASSKQANRLLAKEQQAQAQWMAKLSATEQYPKHLLALEGEGLNALGTLAALLALEQALRRQSGRFDYHLCQTFELVGGTGLSAFFATAIALGHPMSDFQSVFIDKITLLYSNPRSDFESVQLYLLNFMREYFGKTTLAEANWQSGICYFLRHYESGQPLLIDNHPDGKTFPDNGALTLAELLLAAGNPFSTSAVQLEFPSSPVRVVDISNGLFRNPELLLFYQATSADGPFQWPATNPNDLRLCSIGTQLDPDIPNPAIEQNDANPSAPRPEAIAAPRSPLSAAHYQYQRLSRWLLEGESLAGSHTDSRPVLGANPALLSRIALPPVPESRLLDWEYLRAQADRALESADLSAFLPKLQAQ
ncbi:MAG: hypothetical protein IT260_03290 [Saprospiraceae bacterium]|nr:hypothetical protein [Saprospiraceae bacterium]